jgi:hypothetical protein
MMMLSSIAYLAVMLVLFLLRRFLGLFWSASTFLAATLAFVIYGFDPPIPSAIIFIYGGTGTIAVLLYVTSSDEGRTSFFRPIKTLILGNTMKMRFLQIVFGLGIPALIGWQAYQAARPSDNPPARVREVHVSPPGSLTVQGQGDKDPHKLDMVKQVNPLLAKKTSAPDEYAKHLKNGKVVYYQNCYFCHGDMLRADGHYAKAFNPLPADFTDTGNLPMLRDTYVFWRIAKGGLGLPSGGGPWDSSMPVWEKMLSWQEMWEAVLYIYDYTGFQPRGVAGAH